MRAGRATATRQVTGAAPTSCAGKLRGSSRPSPTPCLAAGPGRCIPARALFGRPAAADVLRRAMVLLADHELNASTFAARVTVSTGASLAAGTLAGLAALSGPLHGVAAERCWRWRRHWDDAAGADGALREWLGEGRVIPGFGHRLYPEAICAATSCWQPSTFRRFRTLLNAAERLVGERPNVDFALAALRPHMTCPRWPRRDLRPGAHGRLARPHAGAVGGWHADPPARPLHRASGRNLAP